MNLQEFVDYDIDWREEGKEYPEEPELKDNKFPVRLILLKKN